MWRWSWQTIFLLFNTSLQQLLVCSSMSGTVKVFQLQDRSCQLFTFARKKEVAIRAVPLFSCFIICWLLQWSKSWRGYGYKATFFNRPGVAGAVLQTTLSLSDWVTDWWFVKISLLCRYFPMVGNGAISHKKD